MTVTSRTRKPNSFLLILITLPLVILTVSENIVAPAVSEAEVTGTPAENGEKTSPLVFREAVSEQGVLFRIELPKPRYALGEPIELKVTLINKSKDTVYFEVLNEEIDSGAAVYDENKRSAVSLTPYGKSMVPPISSTGVDIPIGGQYEFVIALSGIFDLSHQGHYVASCTPSYITKDDKYHTVKVQGLRFSVATPDEMKMPENTQSSKEPAMGGITGVPNAPTNECVKKVPSIWFWVAGAASAIVALLFLLCFRRKSVK